MSIHALEANPASRFNQPKIHTIFMKPNSFLETLMLRVFLLSSIVALSACQSTTGCKQDETTCFAPNSSALTKVLPKLTSNVTDGIAPPTLNPQFNYVRLTLNGRVAWVAQGGIDKPSTPYQATTGVYYSADRSVFKWSNGRLSAVTLPTLNWRERIISPFDWSSVMPLQFAREIDGTDGVVARLEYRQINRSSAPENHSYIGDADKLVWLHEYAIDSISTGTKSDLKHQSAPAKLTPNYDSWYAFEPQNLNEPIYGQQCISKQYCLAWQVWKTS